MTDSILKKNPLAVLFGLALRETRMMDPKSSEEVAGYLPIVESAYRLIESGGAILQPSHTFDLIKVLQTLVWQKMVLYITWTQAADIQLRRRPKKKQSKTVGGKAGTIEAFWESARALAEIDPELTYLAEDAFRPLWEAGSPTELKERQVHPPESCVEALRTYLETERRDAHSATQGSSTKDEDAPSKTLAEWAKRAPGSTSPIHVDALLHQIETLQYFPTTVSPNQFATWERRNYRAFLHVIAYVEDLQALQTTAGDFYWDYLQSKEGKALHILTPSQPTATPDLAEVLCDVILRETKSRSKPARESLLTKIRRRLRIKSVDTESAKRISRLLRFDQGSARLLLDSDNGASSIQLENVWIYYLNRYNTVIGFADNYNRAADGLVIATLSKGEVTAISDELATLWRTAR